MGHSSPTFWTSHWPPLNMTQRSVLWGLAPPTWTLKFSYAHIWITNDLSQIKWDFRLGGMLSVRGRVVEPLETESAKKAQNISSMLPIILGPKEGFGKFWFFGNFQQFKFQILVKNNKNCENFNFHIAEKLIFKIPSLGPKIFQISSHNRKFGPCAALWSIFWSENAHKYNLFGLKFLWFFHWSCRNHACSTRLWVVITKQLSQLTKNLKTTKICLRSPTPPKTRIAQSREIQKLPKLNTDEIFNLTLSFAKVQNR